MKRVRALPRDRGGKIPAAALTAHAGAEDRALTLAAGFDVHISKPIGGVDLTKVVKALFENSHE